MAGRKPIYRPELLKIGEKMPLKQKNIKFGYQYVYSFNKRFEGLKFKFSIDSIERIA